MDNSVPGWQKNMLVVISMAIIILLFMQVILPPVLANLNTATLANINAKTRQRKMDGLMSDIDRINQRARETAASNETYRAEFLTFEAIEDIEWDFTSKLLEKGLTPLAVGVLPEITESNNPFNKFIVNVHASGGMESIISMCDYINGEKSYRLSGLQISESEEHYNVVMAISVVYVKEELPDENR